VSVKNPKDYQIETLYPNHIGAAAGRSLQHGALPLRVPARLDPDPVRAAPACATRFDLQNRS
jgi:hypothetical protein